MISAVFAFFTLCFAVPKYVTDEYRQFATKYDRQYDIFRQGVVEKCPQKIAIDED